MVFFARTLVAREGPQQHPLLPEGSRSTQSGEMRFVFFIGDELSSALSWRDIRSKDKFALQVNAVLANQRELVSATRDIKNFVTDVHRWVLSSMQIECSHFQILDLVASIPLTRLTSAKWQHYRAPKDVVLLQFNKLEEEGTVLSWVRDPLKISDHNLFSILSELMQTHTHRNWDVWFWSTLNFALFSRPSLYICIILFIQNH